MKPLHRVIVVYGVALPVGTVVVLAAGASLAGVTPPFVLFLASFPAAIAVYLLTSGFDDKVDTMTAGGTMGIETSAIRDHGDTQPGTPRLVKGLSYFGGVFVACWAVLLFLHFT